MKIDSTDKEGEICASIKQILEIAIKLMNDLLNHKKLFIFKEDSVI
jgi:hypothetical protein